MRLEGGRRPLPHGNKGTPVPLPLRNPSQTTMPAANARYSSTPAVESTTLVGLLHLLSKKFAASTNQVLPFPLFSISSSLLLDLSCWKWTATSCTFLWLIISLELLDLKSKHTVFTYETCFPHFSAFLGALEKRGVGALELLAMDMKTRPDVTT